MRKIDADILMDILNNNYSNQMALSENSGYSIGAVNKSIKNLKQYGLLDNSMRVTRKARNIFESERPKNAIILAAGYGMRMVPINTHTPKALIEVNGEPLIERLIKQLKDVGIDKIYVVVGFMKEQLEYLIDDYGVELIVNEEYKNKNNLHSLALVANYLSNTYIVPCDIWCKKNPFRRVELYSWYMISNDVDECSEVRVNRKFEVVKGLDKSNCKKMIGISYLTKEDGSILGNRLQINDKYNLYDKSFWEECLYEKDKMIISARLVDAEEIVEINTYEQLRDLDNNSIHLQSDAIKEISDVLEAKSQDIVEITALKKGMTNKSFCFSCYGKKYIMRIPGEGTEQLIDRNDEANVYKIIQDKKICDEIVYINPENGYKITEYIEDAKTCNPRNEDDLRICMNKLRDFHNMKLTVDHEFDIFTQIEFYESLWGKTPSIYRDYLRTKEKVFTLKEFVEKHIERKCLTHIDAVPDNFIITKDGEVRLIDWEYSGMQDPHVDIAMFCIYSLYNRQQIDKLIDIYFQNSCPRATRVKIYCYISACGLLWSNWCEYKRNLGVEFGEYSLRQYRYAKEYYEIVKTDALGGVDE